MLGWDGRAVGYPSIAQPSGQDLRKLQPRAAYQDKLARQSAATSQSPGTHLLPVWWLRTRELAGLHHFEKEAKSPEIQGVAAAGFGTTLHLPARGLHCPNDASAEVRADSPNRRWNRPERARQANRST